MAMGRQPIRDEEPSPWTLIRRNAYHKHSHLDLNFRSGVIIEKTAPMMYKAYIRGAEDRALNFKAPTFEVFVREVEKLRYGPRPSREDFIAIHNAP